jgi:hypothetical protein
VTALAANHAGAVSNGAKQVSKEDTMGDIRLVKHSSHRTLELAQFRLIFGVSFLAFLLGAAVSRLSPWRQAGAHNGRRQSVFSQALSATHRTIPFAFMS